MSKNKQRTTKTGAAASWSKSPQKVVDFESRFIDDCFQLCLIKRANKQKVVRLFRREEFKNMSLRKKGRSIAASAPIGV
jgi:hypothetical protein